MMIPNLKREKNRYKTIEIPVELNNVVDRAIKKGESDNLKKEKRHVYLRTAMVAASITGVAFTIGVNTNHVFATAIEKIPVIREFARLVTFKEFHQDLEAISTNVEIPLVEGIEDAKLEERVNQEIQSIVQTKVKEAEERATEYKKAFVETGGNPEEFHDLLLDIGYELKLANEKILSFELYSCETMASAYTEYYYYTIDLENDIILNLKDVLGENYQQKIVETVQSEVAKRMTNSDEIFFEDSVEVLTINENQPFYLNEDQNVVIVFKKYEIAPGFMGSVEFIIPR